MVKHTQTIRRLLPTNCLSVFDHFVELTPKELIIYFTINDNAEIAVDFGNDGFTGYTKIEKSHA